MICLFQLALSEDSTQLTPLLLLWKIKFGLNIQRMRGENTGFFIIKQTKKSRLCSVLLQSTQEAVEHSRSRENTPSGVERTNHEGTAPP